jgi:hypothetical protein
MLGKIILITSEPCKHSIRQSHRRIPKSYECRDQENPFVRGPSIWFVESETLALFDCDNQPSERSRVKPGLRPLLRPVAA